MAAIVPTYASPNVGNYSIGRGIVEMMLETESAWVDMGNVTRMKFLPNPTKLKHFSSRVGVRKSDFSVVTQLEGTVTFTVEEMTARNMSMAMLATLPGESGAVSISAFTQPIFRAGLRFTGTNDVGPRWIVLFPLVDISPTNGVDLISEGSGSWASIDFTADILQEPTSEQFFTADSSSFT